MLLQNVTVFLLAADQLAHLAVLGPSLVLRQKSNHLHFFFCGSVATMSSLSKKSCWEQNVSLLTKIINQVCAQLRRCNPAVTPSWSVSTRTRDADPGTSEKMSQFTSFVLFTFADYTVARWAAKTTWLISLPEVIHIKDGHVPTEQTCDEAGLSLEAVRIVFLVQNVRYSVRGMFELSESSTTDGTFFIMRSNRARRIMLRILQENLKVWIFWPKIKNLTPADRTLVESSSASTVRVLFRYTSDPFSSFFGFAVRFFTLSVHKPYYCGWFVLLTSLWGGHWHASLLLLCTSILLDWRKAPVALRRWRPARCVPPPSAVFTCLLTGMFFIPACCSEISQTGSPESGFFSPSLCFLTSRLWPLSPSPISFLCWKSLLPLIQLLIQFMFF